MSAFDVTSLLITTLDQHVPISFIPTTPDPWEPGVAGATATNGATANAGATGPTTTAGATATVPSPTGRTATRMARALCAQGYAPIAVTVSRDVGDGSPVQEVSFLAATDLTKSRAVALGRRFGCRHIIAGDGRCLAVYAVAEPDAPLAVEEELVDATKPGVRGVSHDFLRTLALVGWPNTVSAAANNATPGESFGTPLGDAVFTVRCTTVSILAPTTTPFIADMGARR